MNKYSTQFPYLLKDGRELNVIATADDVTHLDIINLELQFFDDNMNPVDIDYDVEIFNDIEEDCHEFFFDAKFSPELQFGEL